MLTRALTLCTHQCLLTCSLFMELHATWPHTHCPVSRSLMQRDKKRSQAMSGVAPTLPSCTTPWCDRQRAACSSQGIQPTMGTPHFQQATPSVESVASLHLAQETLKFLSRDHCGSLGKWAWCLGGRFQSGLRGWPCQCTCKISQKSLDRNMSSLVPSCACTINAAFALSFLILSDIVFLLVQQQKDAVECNWRKWLGDPYSLPTLESGGKGRSSSTSEQQYCLIWNPPPGWRTPVAFLCYHSTISSRWKMGKLRLRADAC